MSDGKLCFGWNAGRTVKCKRYALPDTTMCEEHLTPGAVNVLVRERFALLAENERLRKVAGALAEALEKILASLGDGNFAETNALDAADAALSRFREGGGR